ncbi:hypothetical protein C8Q78DRAFT_492046 [Trametes maxima]|nr:hypothetical protein C8Q78DRAFT_492046 [Trametes maxima]
MSVAYVEDHPTPVMVADELESFFHVTLFYAVRLLRTNIQNVEAYVIDYFDSYRPGKNRFHRACSFIKTTIIRSGILYADSAKKMQFYVDQGHENKNFNAVLAQWLRLFRARYAVHDWERRPAVKHDPGSAGASFVSSDPDDGEPPPPADEYPLNESPYKQPVEEPTADEKEQAKKLDSHGRVMNIIYSTLMAKKLEVPWPDNDVIPDKFQETYDPRETLLAIDHLVASTTGATARSALPRKRARTQASSERPEAGSSKLVATETGYPSPSMKPTGRNPRGKGRIAKSEPLDIAAHDDNPLGALGNGSVDGNR